MLIDFIRLILPPFPHRNRWHVQTTRAVIPKPFKCIKGVCACVCVCNKQMGLQVCGYVSIRVCVCVIEEG